MVVVVVRWWYCQASSTMIRRSAKSVSSILCSAHHVRVVTLPPCSTTRSGAVAPRLLMYPGPSSSFDPILVRIVCLMGGRRVSCPSRHMGVGHLRDSRDSWQDTGHASSAMTAKAVKGDPAQERRAHSTKMKKYEGWFAWWMMM